jgi:type I restriction enzyme S subunit
MTFLQQGEYSLYEIADYINGRNTRSDEGGMIGLPLIKIAELNGGITANTRFVPEGNVVSDHRVNAGDLLFAWSGTVGIHRYKGPPGALNQHIFKVLPKPGIDHAYLQYLLINCLGEFQRRVLDKTTTMGHVTVKDLKEIRVSVPQIADQIKIGHILRALDDKIALNRRMNATLEEMARALFQSWFVDFDPVHAKSEGRQPVGMDAETAALLPDSFEDSALGPIPNGWQINSIDEIAKFLNGLALQKFPVAGERSLPVIKIAQLKNGHDTLRADRCARKIPEEFVIQNGDVLFSWSGSLEVEIWSGGEGALNQHLFKVTSERYPKWFYYLWIITHLEDFRSIASGKATTMGHIQRKHLTAAKALVPSHELMVRMHEILNPIIEQANSFELQVKELRQLRDALLPKLLSGELRVGDVAA